MHVTDVWWDLLTRDGVSVATSYYSDDPDEHNAMTGRPSHARTRANIVKAFALGIDLRAGIVTAGAGQRVQQARRELEALGVTRIRVDHVRPYGRAAAGTSPDAAGLCGNCGVGLGGDRPGRERDAVCVLRMAARRKRPRAADGRYSRQPRPAGDRAADPRYPPPDHRLRSRR